MLRSNNVVASGDPARTAWPWPDSGACWRAACESAAGGGTALVRASPGLELAVEKVGSSEGAARSPERARAARRGTPSGASSLPWRYVDERNPDAHAGRRCGGGGLTAVRRCRATGIGMSWCHFRARVSVRKIASTSGGCHGNLGPGLQTGLAGTGDSPAVVACCSGPAIRLRNGLRAASQESVLGSHQSGTALATPSQGQFFRRIAYVWFG